MMLPQTAPKPKDWTEKDCLVCATRWLEATAHSVYNSWDPNYEGIDLGEKGDPCFGCPAGERCPAYCDATHWKRYTEFYAFENFKLVGQLAGDRIKFPVISIFQQNSCIHIYYCAYGCSAGNFCNQGYLRTFLCNYAVSSNIAYTNVSTNPLAPLAPLAGLDTPIIDAILKEICEANQVKDTHRE